MIDVEEWREVEGFPMYEVSNYGRVKSYYSDRPRIISGTLTSHGYRMVSLSCSGVKTQFLVHRLVCMAFHGAQPVARPHVAHFDGDKVNNAAGNLRWASVKENHSDKIRHGTDNRGSRHNMARLTDASVREIRRRYACGGVTQRALGVEFGVAHNTISVVVNHVAWSHI